MPIDNRGCMRGMAALIAVLPEGQKMEWADKEIAHIAPGRNSL